MPGSLSAASHGDASLYFRESLGGHETTLRVTTLAPTAQPLAEFRTLRTLGHRVRGPCLSPQSGAMEGTPLRTFYRQLVLLPKVIQYAQYVLLVLGGLLLLIPAIILLRTQVGAVGGDREWASPVLAPYRLPAVLGSYCPLLSVSRCVASATQCPKLPCAFLKTRGRPGMGVWGSIGSPKRGPGGSRETDMSLRVGDAVGLTCPLL